jgi:hypothetical protein
MGVYLMNMLGLSPCVLFTLIACYWKFLPFALNTSRLSVQALQSRSCLSYVCYNGSLVTWTVVGLTTAIDNESESYITADGQSASLSWNKSPIWGLRPDFLLLSDSCGFVDVGRSLWREEGSVIYNFCWPSPEQSFSGSCLVGLVTIFYCLRFKTSFFIAFYD